MNNFQRSIYTPVRWVLGALVLLTCSCTKLVDIGAPPNATTGASVFEDEAGVISLMTGQYANMAGAEYPFADDFNSYIACEFGLAADELDLYTGAFGSSEYLAYYRNEFSVRMNSNSDIWRSAYLKIYTANFVLSGLPGSNVITVPVKKQLEGEAKFLRAYNYFYLVNVFGPVPLTLSTDYKVNSLLSRASEDSVYQQIISDLKDAANLLRDDYVDKDCKTATVERVRPNRFTANALLARVYLHRRQWSEAITEASKVIDQHEMYDTVSLDNAFLMNNKEGIWQLQPITLNANTEAGKFFIFGLTGIDGGHPTYLTRMLLDSFETGDARKAAWTHKWTDTTVTPHKDYYYPYKYKVGGGIAQSLKEYYVVFRLAEQYLIRAEAEAQTGQLTAAAGDLNLIRRRALLPPTTAGTAEELVSAILHERQVELFTEGHRWLDLSRSGNLDAVMTKANPLKGGKGWQPYQRWLPIHPDEIRKNRNITQNNGY